MKISKKNLEDIIKEELTGLLKEQDNFSTFEIQIQEAYKAIKRNQDAIKQLATIVKELKASRN